MNSRYKKLSDYIDTLNEDKRPLEHGKEYCGEDLEELLQTVRRIRLLREPVYPDNLYPGVMAGSGMKEQGNREVILSRKRGSSMLLFAVAAAAVMLLAITYRVPSVIHPNTDIVYAMEHAMKEVKAYHGTIEVVETNEQGEETTQAVREVWADQSGDYYVRELTGTTADTITVNNGECKWQLVPEEKKVYLYPSFPDAYRFTFELGREVEDIKAARTVKVLGEEQIAGRQARLVEVIPEGGDPYHLWIDQETKLPLQRESAMQNALQYRITYREITFEDSIPQELIRYQLPKGYQEEDMVAELIVGSRKEAEDLTGLLPALADTLPQGYTIEKISVLREQAAIRYYYEASDGNKTVVVQQSKAIDSLKPASTAVLGKVGSSTAEVLTDSLTNSFRWQENGVEYHVFGNTDMEEIVHFAQGFTQEKITLPPRENDKDSRREPEIKVKVNLSAEESDQKSVDAGHSPWRLDPVFVTQVFASLLISPEGITGDYPIAYDSIEIVENNGSEAVARIRDKDSIAEYVYLKRLIRQDETGIWTVVGYDKRK